MEKKSFPLKLEDAGDAGVFRGVASVYGNIDLQNDAVMPGAFTKTLSERGATVPILWQHEQDNPIGLGTLSDSASGLLIYGDLDLDIDEGRRGYSGLKKGYLKGLSIGYDVIKSSYDGAGVRRLLELKLYEVSLVTFPANELAIVDAVKAARRDLKAGRVLSAATLEKLHSAHSLLDELLASDDSTVALRARDDIVEGDYSDVGREKLKAAHAVLSELLNAHGGADDIAKALRAVNAEMKHANAAMPSRSTPTLAEIERDMRWNSRKLRVALGGTL
jgi:uncharacterized protein